MIAVKNGHALNITKKIARGKYLTANVKVMKQIVPEMHRTSKTMRLSSYHPSASLAEEDIPTYTLEAAKL